MGYVVWSVVFGEQPTATKWNQLGSNDASFNDGTGIGNNAIAAALLATNAIKLGAASITSDVTTVSATAVQVTGLTAAVTVPAGGRDVLIIGYSGAVRNSTSNTSCGVSIWDGTVGSGTQLAESFPTSAVANANGLGLVIARVAAAATGSKTYNVGLRNIGGGTATFTAAATAPGHLLVLAI